MIHYYIDENVHGGVVEGLRRRGLDCLTIFEDDRVGGSDESVLFRSIELDRVVVTSDRDFYEMAAEAHEAGRSFPGVVYFHQRRLSIGKVIDDLHLIAEATTPIDMRDQILRLPV